MFFCGTYTHFQNRNAKKRIRDIQYKLEQFWFILFHDDKNHNTFTSSRVLLHISLTFATITHLFKQGIIIANIHLIIRKS